MSYKDLTEISRKFNIFNYFVNEGQRMTHPNIKNSTFYTYTGERRTGKSTLSRTQAFKIDPDFTVEEVCFSFQELKKELKEDKPGKPLVWEEASVTAPNRRALDEINITLSKFFQVFGFKRRIVIANLQHLGFLDPQVRMQINCVFQCRSSYFTDQNGEPQTIKYFQPFKVLSSSLSFDQWLKKYDIPDGLSYREIGEIRVPPVDWLNEYAGISKKFERDYEKRKMEFFEELGEEEEENKVTKQQLDKMNTQIDALGNLAKGLRTEKEFTKTEIARLMGVNRNTAESWGIYA